jgi:hypothetical protein
MSHPIAHARSSARKFGGVPEDYMAIHHWFDETKAWCADMRHRAMRHHAQGIFECENRFGFEITNSNGKQVQVRYIGEQHIIEDIGFIPTAQDWLNNMSEERWMLFRDKVLREKLDRTFGDSIPESVGEIVSGANLQSSHEQWVKWEMTK